jgi:hypothetical protein
MLNQVQHDSRDRFNCRPEPCFEFVSRVVSESGFCSVDFFPKIFEMVKMHKCGMDGKYRTEVLEKGVMMIKNLFR